MPRSSENCPEGIAIARFEVREERGGSAFGLWILPLILTTFGVVAIASMTGWHAASPGMKQSVWFVAALAGFLAVTQIPLKFWHKFSLPLLLLSFAFLVLTLASPLRVTVKGASRWLRFHSLSFQPLELVSFAMMIHFSKVYNRVKDVWKAVIVSAVLFVPFALVIMKQPDFGGLLMLSGLVGALFVERYGFLLPLAGAAAASPLLWYLANYGYRAERIMTWLDPWNDPLGAGYQVIQGLVAFANGGLWGIGMGRGQQFLPEVHNDFIFPALGEQFGLLGTGGVLALFLLWTLCAYSAYKRTRPERRIAVWGCCVSVLLPFFINLGGVMKIIPLTGMPLPFISYGGTSLVFMWARIGFLVRLVKEPEGDE